MSRPSMDYPCVTLRTYGHIGDLAPLPLLSACDCREIQANVKKDRKIDHEKHGNKVKLDEINMGDSVMAMAMAVAGTEHGKVNDNWPWQCSAS